MSGNYAQFDRSSYVIPGGLINAEATRSAAVRRANSEGTTTIIHYHRHGMACKGKHEYVTKGGIEERDL